MKQQHPLSAAYPAMVEADYQALVEDIRTHGQRDIGTVYDNMVLDGWHRYRACNEVGIPFRFEPFNGSDPAAFVISKNTHRRQLSASQRAAAVIAVHAWRPADEVGKPTNRGTGEAASPVKTATVAQMAAEAGTTGRTIQQAKRAAKAGLGDAVRDGRVSAERAAEIATMPAPVRQAAVEDSSIKAAPAKPELTPEAKTIKELREKITVLIESNDELQAENDKLRALVDGEDASAKLIDDLNKQIKRLHQESRNAELRRDDEMNRSSELKKQVKILERKLDKLSPPPVQSNGAALHA